MNDAGIKALLQLGFTYEDLYNKGILIVKPAEPIKADPTPMPEQNEQNAQKEEPAETQPDKPDDKPSAEPEWKEAIADLKKELMGLIQNQNRQDMTRKDEPSEQITLADAIQGLAKGG